jgi:hypothetical protein
VPTRVDDVSRWLRPRIVFDQILPRVDGARATTICAPRSHTPRLAIGVRLYDDASS